jgi:hypothetical protein
MSVARSLQKPAKNGRINMASNVFLCFYTATPQPVKNLLLEGLTNPIFLVYSQMARGLLSQQGITVG